MVNCSAVYCHKIRFRSNRSLMFYKIGVLKNFSKFTGKHLRWSLCNLIFKRDSSTGQKQPPEVFYIKGVFRNFPKLTGKYLRQTLLFNNVAGLRPATLLKKSLWHMCFSVNFAKFFGTPFLQNTSERLLLTFRSNSLFKKNLSDVSTSGCLLFLGNFPSKLLQLNLCFTLRLQFIFKYLKSQNERVLSRTFSTKPHTNSMHFFIKTL